MDGITDARCEQHTLKQELEKLKADYQSLFDENPLALLVADNCTSKFIGVNKSALKKYGYTKREFSKLTLEDISKGPCGTKIISEVGSCHTRHYKKDGSVLYVEVKKSAIVYKSVASQLITIYDVTEKVLAEKEKKTRQRIDMNSSLDIICSTDRDGRFVQVSEACKSVLGYAPEELAGKFILDFVDPESVQSTKAATLQLAQGQDVTGFQNVFIHKNGNRITINWSARMDADQELVFWVGRNVSSQVEAEKLKAVAEQRFTAVVNKGADMVGIIDAQGNYLYASPNIESVLGYKPEDMYRKSALQLIHPDDVHMAYAELEKVIVGNEVKLAAFRYKHANGEWRWFETIATNQLDNPAIKGIVINSRDITKRMETETEKELMIKELLKSNADLKQFSFITSHNLRAPLSNIIGILNIIDYSDLSDYNREMLKMLDISSQQLRQTIDDLSKILVIKNNVNIEISTIDLEESIDEVKRTFINTLNDVCATVTTDFKVKKIDFNKTYFQSILINLVSNSIRYRSAQRNLFIKTMSDVNADGNVVFTFSDNGSGIDVSRHKNKIFGLYQRFHNNPEGQGLGLFIIKSQIVALGGRIDVESVPDKGTTFSITFSSQSSACIHEESKEHGAKVQHVQSSLDL